MSAAPEPASTDGGPAHDIPVRAPSGAEAAPAADAPSQGAARPDPDAARPDPEPEAEGSAPGPAAEGAPPGRGGRRRRIAAAAVAVVAAAAITAGVLVSVGHHDASTDDRHPVAADGLRHTSVDASPGGCGQGWGGGRGKVTPRPGTQVFDLHNSAAAATEVDLIDPRTGKVYGEIEGLAPATSRPMVVDLGSGTYAFKCLQEDTDAVTGPTVTVPGTAPRGPGGLPVTEHDLIPPTLAYQTWIGTRMTELAGDTGALKDDVDRGDLAAARRDWLSGHLVYERMGAAYDTFGDADAVINGTAPLGPGAAHDPDFTGFHRIEYGLWHGGSARSLRGPAAALDKAVRALRATWSTQRMDPANMGLRAHEIIENAEQFELTGRTDYGSGTNLATARANIDGTREILGTLNSLLVPRDTGLAALNASLDRAAAGLDAQRHGGRWTPLADLTRSQRERINADFGDLLEQLAPVAAIFDVRRTA